MQCLAIGFYSLSYYLAITLTTTVYALILILYKIQDDLYSHDYIFNTMILTYLIQGLYNSVQYIYLIYITNETTV